MAWALVIAMSSAEAVGPNRPLPRAAVLTQSPHALPSPRPRRGARVRTPPAPQRGGSTRAGGWDGGPRYQGAVCDFKVKGRVLISTESPIISTSPGCRAVQCGAAGSGPGGACSRGSGKPRLLWDANRGFWVTFGQHAGPWAR